MSRITFGCLVLVSLVSSGLRAADINIVKSGVEKSPLDLSSVSGPGSASYLSFVKTLKADLNRSGWFTVTSGPGALIRVSGNFRASGDSLSFDCLVVNTATATPYLDRRIKGQVGSQRKLAHEVADAIVLAVKKVPGIASTRIAMIGAHGTGKDLYVCDADGENLTRITRDNAVCISPNWGPTARVLTYTSFKKGFPDVYKIDLASGQRDRIVKFPGLNAGGCLSPDGRKLALTLSKDGNPDLYVVSMRGGKPLRLTRTSHAAEASPAWSPDGSRIVFVSDSSGSPQVYSMDSKGGRPKRMTYHGSENVAPEWSKDGRIVFSSRRDRHYQICVIDLERGEKRQITHDGADYEDPSWAPDGRHIVCSRTEHYRSQLYVLDYLGGPPLRLTTLAGDWYSPVWSPK